MFNFVGDLAQTIAFAVLWRQVMLLVGAGVYGSVCWAVFRNKTVHPFTRALAVLGGLVIFCVLSIFVWFEGGK